MKKTLLVFVLFLLTHITTAQNIEDEWFIEKVIIGEIEYQAPVNNETFQFILYIYWDWDIYVFDNYHCGRLSNGAGIWFDNDTLYLGFLDYSTTDCVNSENNLFRDQHFGIYLNDVDKEFAYEVTYISNGDKQLVITNEFGDQAIYLSPILGIPEDNTISFKIYPNPVSDKLYISSDNTVAESTSIYSLTGKKILEAVNETNSINVSALSKGMYFLELTSSEGKTVKKFIKK